MPNNLDKVISGIKFLGLSPNVHEYRGRFFTQKTAFLAKALGMEITYDFTVYVAGPYSRELTCDYYAQRAKLETLQTDYELTQSDVQVLEKIKACSDIYDNMGLMEATSTIVYLKTQNPELTDDNLFVRLKRLKPHLTDGERTIGITRAKELLFKPEYLTEEIAKEMDEWDRLDN
jgi:uncharacterized protein YwgA